MTLQSLSCLNLITEGDSRLRPDIIAPQNWKDKNSCFTSLPPQINFFLKPFTWQLHSTKQGFHPNYSSLYKIVCLCVCVHAFLHTYFGVLRDVRLKMQRFKSRTVLSLIVTGTFTNFDWFCFQANILRSHLLP